MKTILPLLFLFLVLLSCKTNQLYINVLEPAPVTIPSYVKTVGVINRSFPTEETKVFDAIEKVFSLEGVDLDRDGALEALKGLTDELNGLERFDETKVLTDIDLRTSRLEGFPVPLSWEIVAQICEETGTDALFSLEKYDTDTHVNIAANKIKIETPFGNMPGIEHQADMLIVVKTGWRIYDPGSRSILDQFINETSIDNTGRGINPLVAAQALTGRKTVVKQVSNEAGHNYASRIMPYRVRVYRDYFVKGTDNFKIAKRKAQIGLWDEAGDLWARETENPSRKVAGRAYYNMAIISEINGNLDDAMGWAQKAWTDYNIRQAKDYVRILDDRRYKMDLLNEQGN